MIRQNQKLSFIFLTFAIILNGCDFYYKNTPFVSIPPQTVSGAVEIGSDWTEITPPEPLKPHGRSNWINLGYDGFKKIEFLDADEEKNVLELADGRKTRIEAFLFDDKGDVYELEVSQTSNGPELNKKGDMKIVNGQPDYSATRFPGDRVYTKLKIRSEIPLRCSKIEWIGSNPK